MKLIIIMHLARALKINSASLSHLVLSLTLLKDGVCADSLLHFDELEHKGVKNQGNNLCLCQYLNYSK